MSVVLPFCKSTSVWTTPECSPFSLNFQHFFIANFFSATSLPVSVPCLHRQHAATGLHPCRVGRGTHCRHSTTAPFLFVAGAGCSLKQWGQTDGLWSGPARPQGPGGMHGLKKSASPHREQLTWGLRREGMPAWDGGGCVNPAERGRGDGRGDSTDNPWTVCLSQKMPRKKLRNTSQGRMEAFSSHLFYVWAPFFSYLTPQTSLGNEVTSNSFL